MRSTSVWKMQSVSWQGCAPLGHVPGDGIASVVRRRARQAALCTIHTAPAEQVARHGCLLAASWLRHGNDSDERAHQAKLKHKTVGCLFVEQGAKRGLTVPCAQNQAAAQQAAAAHTSSGAPSPVTTAASAAAPSVPPAAAAAATPGHAPMGAWAMNWRHGLRAVCSSVYMPELRLFLILQTLPTACLMHGLCCACWSSGWRSAGRSACAGSL